jgi:hypothetical protein
MTLEDCKIFLLFSQLHNSENKAFFPITTFFLSSIQFDILICSFLFSSCILSSSKLKSIVLLIISLFIISFFIFIISSSDTASSKPIPSNKSSDEICTAVDVGLFKKEEDLIG